MGCGTSAGCRVKPKDIERFRRYIQVAPNGCWLWTGYIDEQGYGVFTYGQDGKRRTGSAHRIAWQFLAGRELPDFAHHLDHVCHSQSDCQGGRACLHRRCANPEHLEVVSPQENIRRARDNVAAAQRARFAILTHCRQGHELAGANLIVRHGTQRVCRTCLQRAKREYAARKRREAGVPVMPWRSHRGAA